MGASLALRIGTLDAGYWIDEGIAVGIASHDLADIPRVLGQDGNPPLYYLLLHGWMQVFGTSEAATRALSLRLRAARHPGFVLGRSRASSTAAPGRSPPPAPRAARSSRTTRRRRACTRWSCCSRSWRRPASCSRSCAATGATCRCSGCGSALLLYTHTWGLFLTAAMAVAWLMLWRKGEVAGRDGARLGAALALIYAPWLPTIVFQAAHTAAPWAERPSPLLLLGIPGGLFGHIAVPLLALAVFAALRRRPPVDRAVRVLAGIAIATAGLRVDGLADPAGVGQPLSRRPARPAAAGAGVGRLARHALDGGRAGRRRRRVADERAAADQEQRAHGVGRRRAVDPARRPRRLDAARAGPRAVPLSAPGRRLPDADGPRLRPAPDGLARRVEAPARRPGGDASCCR